MRGEEWDAQASAWIQTRYMFWGMRLAASYIENGSSDLRTYGYTGGADSEAFVRVELSNHDGDYELARDFQGTILALIDRGTGAVVERYRYTPWGEVSIEDASGTPQSESQYGNRRFFMGRLWDAEIGIYDVRARWYEPDRGAFAGPDPLGAVDSWNLYQYGFATPGRWSDPFGLQSGSPGGGTLLWDTPSPESGGGSGIPGEATSCLSGRTGRWDDPDLHRTRSRNRDDVGDLVEPLKKVRDFFVDDYAIAFTGQTCDGDEVPFFGLQWWIAAVGITPVGKVFKGAKSAWKVGKKTLEEGVDDAVDLAGRRVYRVWGGDSKPFGESWTPVNPGAVDNFRGRAGLPSGGSSGYNNTGQFVTEGVLEDTTGVIVRPAGALDGNPGGLTEYLIPDSASKVRVTNVSGANPEL